MKQAICSFRIPRQWRYLSKNACRIRQVSNTEQWKARKWVPKVQKNFRRERQGARAPTVACFNSGFFGELRILICNY